MRPHSIRRGCSVALITEADGDGVESIQLAYELFVLSNAGALDAGIRAHSREYRR